MLVPLILLMTGLSGFVIGLLHPNWQLAVEGAQIVSGIVEYPEKLPLYQYYVNLWTILNQICALFLRLGISERSLSFFLSGLMGMVSFQALALCIFAFSRNFFLAITFPFLILYSHPEPWSVNYGIELLDFPYTYGVFALSFPFLVIGLFGVKHYKLGGFFLGLAPAIHPASGVYLNLVIVTCLLWDFGYLRRYFKEVLGALLLGYALSVLSLVYHLSVTKPELGFMSEASSDYMSAFVRYWDAHRHPIVMSSPQFLLFVNCLVISIFCLTTLKTTLARNTLFLLRVFVVSWIFSLAFSSVHFLPPEKVPSVLLTFMPARFLEFNILGTAILLIGLLDLYKDTFLFGLTFSTLLVALFLFPNLPSLYLIWIFSLSLFLLLTHHLKSWRTLVISGLVYLMYGFYLALGRSQNPVFFERYTLQRLIFIGLCVSFGMATFFVSILKSQKPILLNRLRKPLAWIRLVAVCLMIIAVGTRTYLGWDERIEGLKDWTNDPLFLRISKGQGLMLTSSNIGFVQLRTRRPVLLDGSILDTLTYAPETGPEMTQILKEIYGVDLFNPPPDIPPRTGGLVRNTGKTLWERRTPQQWNKIGKKFKVTNVLAYADWDLKLPVVARNSEFTLYQIP